MENNLSTQASKKKHKKWPIILIIIVVLLVIIGVVGGQSGIKKGYQDATASATSASDIAKSQITADESKFKSYNQQIARYSGKKDKENTTKVLTEASKWSDTESDALLKLANSTGLDKSIKQACLDVKTGLYAAKSDCYDPMIKVMEGKSDNVPDYQAALEKAAALIDNAYDTIK